MRLFKQILLSTAALSAATYGFSQSAPEAPELSKGTQELGVAGNVDWSDDIAYNLNITYSKFLYDDWSFGFNTNIDGVESDLTFSLGLLTEYHFFVSDSKWVPYVGGSMNWATIDSDFFDSSAITLGVEGGVKYFIRSNVALSFSIGAHYAFDDVFPGGDDFASKLNIGTRFYF